MTIEETAKSHFNGGCNCAESVLLALSAEPAFRRDGQEACVPRLATGFGGGVARNGYICGALAGGIMAIGLALGRDSAQGSRDPCYPAADAFYNEFRDRFGGADCRTLTGVDLKTPQGRQEFQARAHFDRCNPIVAWAAKRADEIVREYLGGSTGMA